MLWKAIVYYPLAATLYLLSLLPLPVLYVIADFFYLVLYYMMGYRRKVVRQNLSRSFPAADEHGLRQTEKQYYRHLASLLAESVWAITASRRQISRRCVIHNQDLLQQLYAEKQDFICVMGHLGNWEWCGLAMSTLGLHDLVALYRPIRDPYFNRFMLRFRTRFGAQIIPMQQIVKRMLQPNEKPTCVTFIADQTPPPQYALWTEFMCQDTPFFTGYETLARKYQLPVVFTHIRRIRRGHYAVYTERIPDELRHSEGELVRYFARRLEEEIRHDPPQWIWSHRRWKHRRKTKN